MKIKTLIKIILCGVSVLICAASLIVNIHVIQARAAVDSSTAAAAADVAGAGVPDLPAGIYPESAYVVGVFYNTKTVVLETGGGVSLWWRGGVDDLQVFNIVSLLMYDNGTPADAFDDIILGLEYSALDLQR